ncbi:hypothetical protein TcG_10811 [Trypanosoma cruzi]|nr:hypothetical protein TcG_10811 [Trypanosoma cruzi]
MRGTFVPLLLYQNSRPKRSAGGQRHRGMEMWSPKSCPETSGGITCRLSRAGLLRAVRNSAPKVIKRCFRRSYWYRHLRSYCDARQVHLPNLSERWRILPGLPSPPLTRLAAPL